MRSLVESRTAARQVLVGDASQPFYWDSQVGLGHSRLLGQSGAFASASFSERRLNHDAASSGRATSAFLFSLTVWSLPGDFVYSY